MRITSFAKRAVVVLCFKDEPMDNTNKALMTSPRTRPGPDVSGSSGAKRRSEGYVTYRLLTEQQERREAAKAGVGKGK